MSCTDIAKYFLHFMICRGTAFAVPWYFCFGTFCPKVKARSVSTGPADGVHAQAQRSGLRGERRSKGARAVFAARRKRNKADFATTRVWGVSPTSILESNFAARRRKNFECVHTRIACQKRKCGYTCPACR